MGQPVYQHRGPSYLFYESFWNLIGLLLILFIVSKGRRFDGENTWFYFLWYGLGRSWIEGLRTDSLYLFNWELFGQRIRVSQALSIVMVAVAAFMLFYNIRIKKRSPESLWVHQVAAEKARLAAAEAEDAVLAETLMNEVPTEEKRRTRWRRRLWSSLTPRPFRIRKHRRNRKRRDAWQRELTEKPLRPR